MRILLFLQIISLPLLSSSQELFTSSELLIEEGLNKNKGKYLKMSDYVIIFADYTSEELYKKRESIQGQPLLVLLDWEKAFDKITH